MDSNEAQAEFARDADHDRRRLTQAIATLTQATSDALEALLAADYRAQFVDDSTTERRKRAAAVGVAQAHAAESLRAVARLVGARL